MKKTKIYTIIFIIILLAMCVLNNKSVKAGLVSDCQSMVDTTDDGDADGLTWPGWDSYCKSCKGVSSCCNEGVSCKCPCDVSYCSKDKCVKLDRVCDYDDYSPIMTIHCHGCDWIKQPRSNWHGAPTMDITSPTSYDKWVANGCCHYHSAEGKISGSGCGGMCLNYKLGFAKQNGSNICATDADCKTTTTTKGSTVCKTGETNPHYTCDNVNQYDYKKGTYTGVYCVKKDWCGITNCDAKYNESEKKAMYIQGVWFNEAIYYHNDRCKVCSTGQKYPHTECKQKTTTYYDRTLRKNVSYTYYACEKIDSCGADKCDYSKNTTKGLGAYEDYDVYGKAYTSYDKYVSESSECIPKPTIPTKPTTPSTGPTIPTDRYVCDPKAEKVDGYGKCILDNQNKYPTAKSCNKANNKVKFIDIPCNGKDNVTCLKPISYNTDCIDGASNPPKTTPKPTTPPPTKSEPISPITCRIPIFGFYDQLSQPPKYLYNLFTTKKIVENPTLEYYAENCESCKLVITSEDGNSVDEFIIDNNPFQNNLEPTTVIDEKNDRYAFEASNIKLDTKRLKSGNYILSINCFDPILGGPVTGTRKFTNDEEFPPWLKLTIAPEIRWREVVPVINN